MDKKEIDMQIALGTLKIENLFLEELKLTVAPITVPYNRHHPMQYAAELDRVAIETKTFYKEFIQNRPEVDPTLGECSFVIDNYTELIDITLHLYNEEEEGIQFPPYLTDKIKDYLNIDPVVAVGLALDLNNWQLN